MSIEDLQTKADLSRFIAQEIEKPENQLPAAPTTIRGQVSAAGAVVEGDGFTSEKTATGIYKITLAKTLGSTGILTVTPIVGSAGFLPLVENGTQVFVVTIRKSAEALEDGGFNFRIEPS